MRLMLRCLGLPLWPTTQTKGRTRLEIRRVSLALVEIMSFPNQWRLTDPFPAFPPLGASYIIAVLGKARCCHILPTQSDWEMGLHVPGLAHS